MSMTLNVYEYGRGGTCVCMFRYTYAGIRIVSMEIERGDRHRTRLCVHQEHRDKGIYRICRKRKKPKRWSWIQKRTQRTQRSQHRYRERYWRKHTHTTQNHRNRQTDKERACGRPSILLVKRQGCEFTLGTPTRREPCWWLWEADFWWYKFLVNLFFFFLPTKFASQEAVKSSQAGYPRDAEVALFTLANPEHSLRFNTHWSAPPVSALARSGGPRKMS